MEKYITTNVPEKSPGFHHDILWVPYESLFITGIREAFLVKYERVTKPLFFSPGCQGYSMDV
jgi:hypothetical protein